MARKIHVAVLTFLLLGYFDLSLWNLFSLRAWIYFAGTLIAGLALIGTLFGERWARYPVLLTAVLIAAEWSLSVWFSVRIGYFAHQSFSRDLLLLTPGIILLLLAAYGCYVAFRYVGVRNRA